MNPADATDVLGEFADSSADDARAAVAAAAAARDSWRETGPVARGALLFRVADLLAERAEEIALLIVREQGKLLREARGEVVRTGEVLRFLAGEGRRVSGATTPADDPRTFAYTFRVPLGAVGLITPWNFPLAIPVWKTAAALVAGCTAVLKPSPLTPWTAAEMVRLFVDAGLPPGVLNLVQGGREPAEAITGHPEVAGLSFTGSVPVGVAIQQAAPLGCCAPSWSSAATMRSSSFPAPIRRRPPMPWCPGRSVRPGSGAAPPAGSLWMPRCSTTSFHS